LNQAQKTNGAARGAVRAKTIGLAPRAARRA
jgi:hypothetical protein